MNYYIYLNERDFAQHYHSTDTDLMLNPKFLPVEEFTEESDRTFFGKWFDRENSNMETREYVFVDKPLYRDAKYLTSETAIDPENKLISTEIKDLREQKSQFSTTKLATIAASQQKLVVDITSIITERDKYSYYVEVLTATAEGENPIASITAGMIGNYVVFSRLAIPVTKEVAISYRIIKTRIY